jgi:hypothetical protein
VPPSGASPYRLLVEGPDDLHSIAHLMKRHGVDWENTAVTLPFIHETNGINELLDVIPVAAKGAYTRLGIVLDADVDLANRWQQIRDRLARVGINLPTAPLATGTIVEGFRPTSQLGIWLMPDNRSPGRLEEFLQNLVPSENDCWTFALQATEEAVRRGCRVSDTVKSTIFAWLAWQNEPGLRFGTALKARVFGHDSVEALAFVAWFRALFG